MASPMQIYTHDREQGTGEHAKSWSPDPLSQGIQSLCHLFAKEVQVCYSVWGYMITTLDKTISYSWHDG